jgi:hypothetical protein
METKRNPYEIPQEEAAKQSPAKKLVKKPDMGDILLSDSQIRELKGKYNIKYMTCEEEEALMEDLCRMGILTNEDCGAFVKSDGSIFDILSRQISADINLLYKMAIAGRYSDSHIEHIRSQQKILDVLEQLLAE